MNTTYEQLREIIIKANPSILDLKFGCKVINKKFKYKRTIVRSNKETVVYLPKDNDFNYDYIEHYNNNKFEIIGRDITLEDVGYCLGKKCGEWGIRFWGNNVCRLDEDIEWIPNKPLKDQSKATQDYLLEVLKDTN